MLPSNKARFMSVLVILAMLFSFANVAPAAAQDETPPSLPGWTMGTGTHFALPNSPYLPVTLDSSVSVTLTLSSVPEVVDLTIVPAAAGSAEFTLGGFAANTPYYRYADNGLNPVTFTTDTTGSFTYTQDLSEGHHVWFRTQPSTLYLYDNATGGDCNASLGTWSSATKTCTLTGNVNDAIFIQDNGITLDGAGYQLSAPGNYAVYSYGFSNLTVKNVNVVDSAFGIFMQYGSNITVKDNTITGPSFYYYGIVVYNNANNSTVTGNSVSGAYYYGIVAGYYFSNNNIISGNTVSNNQYGMLVGYYSTNNQIYNNNFVNNSIPFLYYDYSVSGIIFNKAAPVGGNYFSNFNTPGQGCNDVNSDGFCDAPYIFSGAFGGSGQDNLPWTTQNGWVAPTDATAPVIAYTLTPPSPDGANGWYKGNVTLAWSVTDPESAVTMTDCVDQNITADQAATSYSCSATSAGGSSGPVDVSIKRDATLPLVSLIGGPANSGSYYFGSVPAAPTCSASDALSGLDGSCTVSGYSALVGPQTVTTTATDMASNQNTASAAYTVLAWTTNGFFQPVDMGGVWNTVKGGSTVPLKFEVFAGSAELTDPLIVNQPLTATQTLCSGGAIDAIELVATGATSLRYDTTDGQFIYNWKTPKKPGFCYVVTITMADGSTISANFQLK